MAKKPINKKAKRGYTSASASADNFAGSSLDFFSELRAKSIVRPSHVSAAVVGIPLTQFILRYLFGNNVFRLGMFTELVGAPAAGKTALQHEMERWHIYGSSQHFMYSPQSPLGGAAKHICAEPRFSPDLAESIIGLSPIDNPYYQVADGIVCVEDWQEEASNWIKLYEQASDKGSPILFASCIGEDSLTSVTTREEMNKTWEAGSANPGFAQIAKSLNLYFKVMPNKLAFFPISFIGTNHQKSAKNNQGFNIRREPGGAALTFGGTTILRVECRSKSETRDSGTRRVLITHQKNSLSSAGEDREIEVNMWWTQVEERVTQSNPAGQYTLWDWDDATTDFLLSFAAGSSLRKSIDAIVYIENPNKGTRTADCKQYGLKKASWNEIGRNINADKAVSAALDALFNITQRTVYLPGVDYKQQQQAAIVAGSTTIDSVPTEAASEEEQPES